MPRLSTLLMFGVFGACSGNGDDDSVDSSEPPVGCGDLGFVGECDGTELRWCACDDPSDDAECRATGTLVEVDCAVEFSDPLHGTCLRVDDVFGYACGVAEGDPCVSSEGVVFCDGDDAGCLVDADGATCATDLGTCEEDTFAQTCSGDLLFLYCVVAQPVTVDCAAHGGTCDAESAVCVGVGEGGPCGPTSEPTLACGEGLECVGATATDWGTCTVADR